MSTKMLARVSVTPHTPDLQGFLCHCEMKNQNKEVNPLELLNVKEQRNCLGDNI
jgi:hypothetical protein